MEQSDTFTMETQATVQESSPTVSATNKLNSESLLNLRFGVQTGITSRSSVIPAKQAQVPDLGVLKNGKMKLQGSESYPLTRSTLANGPGSSPLRRKLIPHLELPMNPSMLEVERQGEVIAPSASQNKRAYIRDLVKRLKKSWAAGLEHSVRE